MTMGFRRFLPLVWLAFLLSNLLVSAALYNDEDTNIVTLKSVEQVSEVVKRSSSIWMIQFYHQGSENSIVAKDYKNMAKLVNGIYPLAVVDLSTEGGKSVAKEFGLSASAIQKSETPVFYTLAPSPFDNTGSKPQKITKASGLSNLIESMFRLQSQVISNRSSALGLSSSDSVPESEKPKRNKQQNGDAVVEINAANFDTHVLQNPLIVAVAFTAPWCGHCTRLKPEWSQAAQKLAGEGVVLGWVDATANEELASVFGVRGYPTIKVFPGGAPKTPGMAVDYQGEREAGAIVQNLLLEVDRSGVPKEIPELTSMDILEESCGGHNHICVLAALPHILDSGADGRNKYRDILAATSKSFRGSSFSFLWFEFGQQPELENALELTFGAPAVVAYSMDRQAYVVLRGAFSKKAITTFLYGITNGRQRTIQLQQPEAPKVITTQAWDGKDAAPIEDEIPLSEIMGDEF